MMERLITEKATETQDLPHAFEVRQRGFEDGTCARCGRDSIDPLHLPQIVETAALGEPALQTEKGS